MDTVVSELMGVSKAVLDHVIFCHQEESLWCFQSDRELQSVFDEIFDTASYKSVQKKLEEKVK